MSLNHAQINAEQKKEIFRTELNAGLKKQKTTVLDEKGIESIGNNYSKALVAANNAKMFLNYENLKIRTESEVPLNEINTEAQKQRELSMDRAKQESHSGKQSKQEKAANKRAYFGPLNYDTGTAQNVLERYNARKQQIAQGEIEPQEYKCTGKEFLLPPLTNMQGEIAQKIVNVMIEKDRLEQELARLGKPTTPYDKAAKKYKAKLLGYMADIIDTFFLANGINKATGAAFNNTKKVNAAKTHMALAMEKYEMLARKIDEKITEEMLGDLKKNNNFTQRKNEVLNERRPGRTEKARGLREYLFEHEDAFKQNKEVILKVFAEYLELNRGADSVNARKEGYRTAISDPANYGTVNRSQDLSDAVCSHLDHVARSMDSGADACKAYIEYLIEGKKMSIAQGAYIKSRFGISHPDFINSGLKMNVKFMNQKMGLSQYDTEMKAKIDVAVREAEKKIANMTEKEKRDKKNALLIDGVGKLKMNASPATRVDVYTKISGEYPVWDKMQESRGFIDREYTTKYEVGSKSALRDVVLRHTSLLTGEVPSDKDMLELTNKTAIIVYGFNPQKNKEKVSDEELYQTFHDLMPDYRQQANELMKFKDNNPKLFGFDLSNPDFASLCDNYDIFQLYSKKGQAVRDGFNAISENKKLIEMLSDEEKKECIRLGAAAAAFFSVANNWTVIYNRVCDLTPDQLLDGAFDIRQTNAEKFDDVRKKNIETYKGKFKFEGDVE